MAKIVCAWCDKILKEDAEKETPNVICPECYDREMRPFVEARQRAGGGRAFKPPPREFDCGGFFHSYMVFSLTFGIVFFAIILTAEGLHWMTSGKTPSLIEWIAKLPPASDDAHLRSIQHRLRKFGYPCPEDYRDSFPKSEKAQEAFNPNQGTQNEYTEE